jgi:hypothetical protein
VSLDVVALAGWLGLEGVVEDKVYLVGALAALVLPAHQVAVYQSYRRVVQLKPDDHSTFVARAAAQPGLDLGGVEIFEALEEATLDKQTYKTTDHRLCDYPHVLLLRVTMTVDRRDGGPDQLLPLSHLRLVLASKDADRIEFDDLLQPHNDDVGFLSLQLPFEYRDQLAEGVRLSARAVDGDDRHGSLLGDASQSVVLLDNYARRYLVVKYMLGS